MSQLTNTQILMRDTVLPEEMKRIGGFDKLQKFFEYFSSAQALKSYDLSSEEIMSGIVGGEHDGGCDSVYLFCNEELMNTREIEEVDLARNVRIDLFIFQSKTTTGFSEDAVMRFKTLASNLLNLGVDYAEFKGRYSNDLLSFFETFRALFKKAAIKKVTLNINFIYSTLGVSASENLQAQGRELCDLVNSSFPAASAKFICIGAERLFDIYQHTTSQVKNLKLSAPPIVGSNNDYVALVKLRDYFDFIVTGSREIDASLFEANVRDYQGSGAVNKSIQDTLDSNSEDNFWWLNNGVTIVAQKATLVSSMDLQMEEPCIVNGMQTSTEIYLYYDRTPGKLKEDNRSVLVRVLVPVSEEARDHIIYATNNQTPVPLSSLRVTESIHYKIETYFRSRGLYYDRRKNFYKNQGRRPDEIISISFLGQCMITVFLRKPDYARARPSTVLADDKLYYSIYNDQTPLDAYLKCALIGRKVRECLWKNVHLSKDRGLRTNLMFYVLYLTVAVLCKKEKIYPNDVQSLDVQNITNEFITEIIDFTENVFSGMGGTDKVAKGSEFIDSLVKAAVEKWDIHSYTLNPLRA